MLITASNNSFSQYSIGRANANATSNDASALPTESFTLSDKPEPSIATRAGYGATWGVMGAVPLLGTVTNLGAAMGAVWDRGNVPAGVVGVAGAVSNLAGTVTAAVGLFSGNSTALNVGLGMLGASALTAAGIGLTCGPNIK